MTSETHTPGPWTISEEGSENLFGQPTSVSILDQQCFPICEVECRPILHNWDIAYPDMGHWAYGADDGRTQIEREPQELLANARLIAAAPDGLAANKAFVEAVERGAEIQSHMSALAVAIAVLEKYGDSIECAYRDARAALAKAEGRS